MSERYRVTTENTETLAREVRYFRTLEAGAAWGDRGQRWKMEDTKRENAVVGAIYWFPGEGVAIK